MTVPWMLGTAAAATAVLSETGNSWTNGLLLDLRATTGPSFDAGYWPKASLTYTSDAGYGF